MTERLFSTLDPKGEIAVAPRPEGLKLILYTGTGATKKEHIGVTMEGKAAFQFAMEILQHVYRLGEAGK